MPHLAKYTHWLAYATYGYRDRPTAPNRNRRRYRYRIGCISDQMLKFHDGPLWWCLMLMLQSLWLGHRSKPTFRMHVTPKLS